MRTGSQVGRFVVSGLLATASDALAYTLLQRAGLTPDPAKAGSFVVGTAVAFLLARFWTFAGAERRAGQGIAFAALYLTAFAVNVSANHLGLWAGLPGVVAFVAATGCSTVLNFLGQKFVVFRERVVP